LNTAAARSTAKFLLVLCCACQVQPAAAASYFADRPEVRAFAHEMAERHHMREARILRLMRKAVVQPSVLRAIAPPTDPQRRSWADYRALFVNSTRIDGGLEFWEHHRAALARARAEFGVPEEIVVAIIGIETVYGRNAGNYRVLDALATLAFDYPPRADFFRDELEQFLLLTQELGIDPLSVKGSYAGAIGIPQFMPGSARKFALDYDGDGRVDIAGDADDAIGSVANFLSRHGWSRDLALDWPASVTGNAAQALLDAGVKPQFTLQQLAAQGVTPSAAVESVTGPPAHAALALVDLPSREAATEYRLVSDNFYAVTRYNRSSFYAAAAADLAAELRSRHGISAATQ
jgi:membrane-bound lytic murein transglycosylase B